MMRARIKPIIIATAIIFGLLLMGCLQGPRPPMSNSSVMSNLAVTVWISNPCVQPGDKVHLRATVSNHGLQTEVMDLKDKPVLDIVISLDNGEVRWSDGKPLTPELTQLELKPGETKTIEMDWVANSDIGLHGAAAVFHNPALRGYEISPNVPLNIGYCTGG